MTKEGYIEAGIAMDLDLFGAFESGETIDEVAPAENVPSKKRGAADIEAAPAAAKLKPSADSCVEGSNGGDGDASASAEAGAAAAVEPVPRAASGVTHTQVRQTRENVCGRRRLRCNLI